MLYRAVGFEWAPSSVGLGWESLAIIVGQQKPRPRSSEIPRLELKSAVTGLSYKKTFHPDTARSNPTGQPSLPGSPANKSRQVVLKRGRRRGMLEMRCLRSHTPGSDFLIRSCTSSPGPPHTQVRESTCRGMNCRTPTSPACLRQGPGRLLNSRANHGSLVGNTKADKNPQGSELVVVYVIIITSWHQAQAPPIALSPTMPETAGTGSKAHACGPDHRHELNSKHPVGNLHIHENANESPQTITNSHGGFRSCCSETPRT